MKTTEKYFFHLRATNRRIILQSEGYNTKKACINGMLSVFENAKDPRRFFILRSENDQAYFILKAKNGKVIGVSETYTTLASCKKGMHAVIHKAMKECLAFSYFCRPRVRVKARSRK